jgi:putative transposase
VVEPALKREIVAYVLSLELLSERRSCRLIGISRRTYRYQSVKDDQAVIEALSSESERHPGYGFWKLYHTLRRKGHIWNHKRVYRVYCTLRLNIRRRVRKRLPRRVQQPLALPALPDISWSMDFMSDSLYSGPRFRILNIVDDFNRECLCMEIGASISSQRVVRVLDRLKHEGRKPKQIRVDNGPEFLAGAFQHWCQVNSVKLHYIQPGKPMQNGYIERFNGSCRKELLDMYVFESMQEVEQLAWQWMENYNFNRPHKALNFKTPMEVRQEHFVT